MKVKLHAKGLGAQLHFGKKPTTEVLRSRLQELSPLWQKLRNSVSPYKVKVMAVKQAAWPRGFHGVAASSVSHATFATLRSQVMKGLGAEGAGCNPMVHLGCVEHPALDPHVWTILETVRVVREAASEEGLGVLMHEALAVDSTIPPFSLTRLLVNRIHHLGWTCTHGVCIRDSLGEFSLVHISFAELSHRVCLAWGSVVGSAVSHRKTFTGLSLSDFHATRTFVKSLDVTDQGLFRKALNGAHFTNDLVYHYSDTGSLCCEFCGSLDSRYHRFWECPVFQDDRKHCPPEFLSMVPDLPPSLTNHGWAILPVTWKVWSQSLLDLQVPPVQVSAEPFDSPDQWLDVFTDGSCLWPTSRNLRLASWSVVQAHPNGNPCQSQILLAGVVPGLLQSAHRAELLGVLQSLKYAKHWGRSIRIWSDCESVVKRVRKMLDFKVRPKVSSPHNDLWSEVYDLLHGWDFCNVKITKVAAHQDALEPQGAFEQWAFAHNSLADRAAQSGCTVSPIGEPPETRTLLEAPSSALIGG